MSMDGLAERLIARWLDGAGPLTRQCLVNLCVAISSTALILTAGGLSEATAQQSSADELGDELGEPDDFDYWENRRQHSPSTGMPVSAPEERGLHFNLQAGHLAFETFGRDESITPVELFPFVRVHDDLFFGDFRLFVNNSGDLGGNAGLGYRLKSDWGDSYGASIWYDADDTTGELFHQLGLSLEVLADAWEARANGYLPVGDTSQDFRVRLLNQRFVNTNIVYDQDRRWGEALPGVDLELGVRLPGRLSAEHDLRVFGGWYYFPGDKVEDINGFKARVQGDLFAGLSSQVEFTSDDTFGTNVMLGVSWAYDSKFRAAGPGGVRPDRLTEFVRRNYNIIVPKQRELLTGLVAINGQTGNPFVVQHVQTGGGGPVLSDPPSGAVDSPFTSLADARAAGGDLIFVHAGSVISDSLVLQNGDRLIGEGGGHTVDVVGFGEVLLPRATSGSGRPIIQSTSGDSVVLASNTVFSGFIIDGSGGHGIVGNGISDALISHVDIRNTAGSGILLENTAGPVRFTDTRINNAAGPALHINGGGGEVAFAGSIVNETGFALLVEDTTGGRVDLSGATIRDDGGTGILIDNADGDVVVGSARITNSTSAGIDIQTGAGDVRFHEAIVANAAGAEIQIADVSGTVLFDAATVTANAGGPGVSVMNSPGVAAFGVLNVTATGATGLHVENSGGISIAGGNISATGASAAVLRDTAMSVVLTSISSDGAAYGLEIVDAPGTFIVNGNGTLASGGWIRNATIAGVLLENAGTVGFQNLDLTANAIGVDASYVDRLALTGMRVATSSSFGLRAVNSEVVEITNSLFDANGNASDASILLVADDVMGSTFALATSTVASDDGDAIRLMTAAGGEGSSLQAAFANNIIGTPAASGSGLRIDWDGALALSASRNAFGGTGASGRGILINLPSTTKASNIAIADNSFSFSGNNSTAIDITGVAPVGVTAARNSIGFSGTSGTGLAFTLGGGSAVNLQSNAIGDTGGGATGILFRSLSGNTAVAINDTLVNLLNTGVLVDRGIVFTSISGTVSLTGTQNNRINFATQAFSAPASGIAGQILVNGSRVP